MLFRITIVVMLSSAASLLAQAVPDAPAPFWTQPLGDSSMRESRSMSWELKWVEVRGATSYEIRVIDRSGRRKEFKVICATTKFRYDIDFGPVAETELAQWNWQVRARAGGQWGAWSRPLSFSAIGVVAPPPTAPIGATPPNSRREKRQLISANLVLFMSIATTVLAAALIPLCVRCFLRKRRLVAWLVIAFLVLLVVVTVCTGIVGLLEGVFEVLKSTGPEGAPGQFR